MVAMGTPGPRARPRLTVARVGRLHWVLLVAAWVAIEVLRASNAEAADPLDPWRAYAGAHCIRIVPIRTDRDGYQVGRYDLWPAWSTPTLTTWESVAFATGIPPGATATINLLYLPDGAYAIWPWSRRGITATWTRGDDGTHELSVQPGQADRCVRPWWRLLFPIGP